MKIAHLTSAHKRYDTRIFYKECISLKQHNYNVSLIVSDNLGDDFINGIQIFDVGKENSRIKRMLLTTKRILNKAVELDSDIYHFHDPELIPVGLKLLKMNKKVIFDIHENIPLQIKTKGYIPSYIRSTLSSLYALYEKTVLYKFNGLVLAEDSYVKYYADLNNNYEVVLNMPQIEKLEKFINYDRNKNHLFYIGGVNNQRGFKTTLQVINILKDKVPDIFFHCIGPYNEELLEMIEYKKVKIFIKMYGHLPLEEGLKISSNAKIGLSILQPIQNYLNSYSTKIFEYMAMGMPVVTSNFPLYRNIIERYDCGICVNPNNPVDIAEKIFLLLNDDKKRTIMGKNGRSIVIENFSWNNEEKKLLSFYDKIENINA